MRVVLLSMMVLWTQIGFAQSDYSSHEQRTKRLQSLSKSANVSLSSYGKSRGNKDLWLLQIGQGKPDSKPALLIVAGLNGSHLAGTELAIKMAEKMVSGKKIPSDKLLFIIPSANPDAMEQAFAKLKYERKGNDYTFDDDRDGYVDEDSFEDLNNDGLITQIRVKDPSGSFVVSKDDARLLVQADSKSGEKGVYSVYSEGTDNDKDGLFNEDGPGGVDIDKNFTFKHPYFTEGAGAYAASEPETRALLEFLYTHPNIYATITFGLNDNLSNPPKFNASLANQRAVAGVLKNDVSSMELVSSWYHESTKDLGKGPALAEEDGSFSKTVYYHAGRFSFTTPGWWIPAPKENGDAPKGKPAAKPTSDDAAFLKWADQEKLDVFVDWKAIKHPDFPNQEVEVGGIKPFVRWNPPVSYLEKSTENHLSFIEKLSASMPKLEHVKTTQTSLGNGLYRVEVTLYNSGSLPTHAELGKRVKWNQKLVTRLKLAKNQKLVSGHPVILENGLDAGATVTYSWLVAGNGETNITTQCAVVQTQTTKFNLK